MWWLGGMKYPLDYSDGDQTTVPEAPGTTPWNDFFAPFGELSDDERDFDNDGLANMIEFGSEFFKEWEGFPAIDRPDYLDSDSDGDGLVDGWDDQDHDDVSNIEEFRNGTWAMNPCDPLGGASRTCPRWTTIGAEPQKPQHLCLSRTLLSPAGVKGYEHEYKDPATMEPEEFKQYCKRPEDGQGL